MQVVILAGGTGTRMHTHAPALPKALIPVCDRPFIEYQLDLLAVQGLNDILICSGHLGNLIENHVGDGRKWQVHVRYSRENPDRLLGTGGAVVNALPMLEEAFLTLYGDSYLPTDYSAIVDAFNRSSSDAIMSVFRNEGQWDASNVRVENGMVSLYSKSAPADQVDHIDYGITGFHRHHIEAYQDAAMPLDLASIQGALVEQGHMRAFEVHERFYEIGKPEGLAELETYLKEN
jgi:MurNAc alpha-1-phosphate uridylyltransferase